MVSLADSLWHRNRVLAEAALGHPFVQGIASGELTPATFAYYVGQDAAFLDAFSRAYALALAKSPDQDGLSRSGSYSTPPPRSFAFTAATRTAGTSTFTKRQTPPPRPIPTSCWRSLRSSRLATSRRR